MQYAIGFVWKAENPQIYLPQNTLVVMIRQKPILKKSLYFLHLCY